jgi:hypothetical protein
VSSTRLVAAASFGVPEFARVLESVVERYGSTPDSTTSSSRSTRTHVRPGSRLEAPNAWCTKLFPTTFFTLRRRNVPPLDGENARHNDHGPIGNRTTLPLRLRYRAKLVHLRSNLKARSMPSSPKKG